VLRAAPHAPEDLRSRACLLAGVLLELGGRAGPGQGAFEAAQCIDDGRAWTKFVAICEAQGGMRTPTTASLHDPVLAAGPGLVSAFDNRKLAVLAKLAGAPEAKAAGIFLHFRIGDLVNTGEPLITVHSQTRGELAYALAYAAANPSIVTIAAPT
jgi:thymidine phosphorylase